MLARSSITNKIEARPAFGPSRSNAGLGAVFCKGDGVALENYKIRQIDYASAMTVIVREHYLHRQDRPRKHRYVFINAKGRRRAEIFASLRYRPEPYPKAPN